MTPPLVFISYCRENRKYRDELYDGLMALERDGQIKIWSDVNNIRTGQFWDEEIRKAISAADIAILLITQPFLTSEFINAVEAPLIYQRSKEEGLELFPILASHCVYDQVSWLRGLQLRSEDGVPIWLLDDDKRSIALIEITRQVATLARKVRQQRQSPTTQQQPQPQPQPTPLPFAPQPEPVFIVRPPFPIPAPSQSRRRLVWSTFALFVTLFFVWAFFASICFKKSDLLPLTFSHFTVVPPPYKFISPEEQEPLWFTIKNGDTNTHHALFQLQHDDTNRCTTGDGASNTLYNKEMEKGDSKSRSAYIRCQWHLNYFSHPQPAGLELDGSVDHGDSDRKPLLLYIAPLPYIRRLERYLRYTLVAGFTFFFFLLLYKSVV